MRLGEDIHQCVAVADVVGRHTVLTGDSTVVREAKRVRLRDLVKRHEIGHLATGHSGYLRVLTTGDVNGRPSAVTVDEQNTMAVWDLSSRRLVGRRPSAPHTTSGPPP